VPSGYHRFVKLYRTQLIKSGKGVLVIDPVRIEVFSGSRRYQLLAAVAPSVMAVGREQTLLAPQQIVLAAGGTYIELKARVRDPAGAREFCENQCDRAAAILAAALTPDLFVDELWRGWIVDGDRTFGDRWAKLAAPIDFNANALQVAVTSFKRSLGRNSAIDNRFTLMSKLLARATVMRPGEEKFLWLWTILEVFPMRNTSDIGPISELLAVITGESSVQLKDKLQIGRLFGARSDLVHDGILPIAVKDLGVALARLEAIVLVIIRHVGGMTYDSTLDEYLK